MSADSDYQDLGISKPKVVLLVLKAIILFVMFFKGIKAHKNKNHSN